MEATGLFVAAVSTPALGIATWLILSRLFGGKKTKKKNLESIVEDASKELNELYEVLSKESYKNLSLIFLDKTQELLDGQKRFRDAFLFSELKYASIYLNQFLKSLNAGNKNPYLIYKTKHFLVKSIESIPSLYARKKIENIILALDEIEKLSS
ncbi:MAG: hypothetical protein ACP5O8_04315 [Candidatus Aenigmatarchaeota archaeon]